MTRMLNLRSSATDRNPARTELAAAIEAASKAERDEQGATAAVTRAQEMVATAATKLEATTAEIVCAREAQSIRVAEAATTGQTLQPDRTMREARSRELDATDELDAAKAALATLETVRAEAEFQRGKARERLKSAAMLVAKSAAQEVKATIGRLWSEIRAKQAEVYFLSFCVEGWSIEIAQERQAIEGFLSIPPIVELTSFEPKAHPAYAQWQLALDALMVDADAPLPNI